MPITDDQIVAAITLEREVMQILQPQSFDMAKADTRERRELAVDVSKARLAALEKTLSEVVVLSLAFFPEATSHKRHSTGP